MRHYKDKMLNQQYQNLLGKTPEYLIEHKVFGALHYCFKTGYDGKPEPHYIVRNTFAHVAYMAGRDTRAVRMVVR